MRKKDEDGGEIYMLCNVTDDGLWVYVVMEKSEMRIWTIVRNIWMRFFFQSRSTIIKPGCQCVCTMSPQLHCIPLALMSLFIDAQSHS
jgi:hypothetical protein